MSWIVKAVGGTTTHWAGASPALPGARVQGADRLRRRPRAPICSTGRSRSPSWSPITPRPRTRWASTRTDGIPGLPGNNNFKVFEAGAERLGYKEVHTGRMAINASRATAAAACQQIGFCFQGCKSGAKWSTLYTEIPQGRGDRQSRAAARMPWRCRSSTTPPAR